MEVIGTGSMGVIYRALEPRTRRPIALKTLRGDLIDDPAAEEFVTRLRMEAQAAGRLKHPGIVAVHAHHEARSRAYLSMEYVDAPSLQARLDEGAIFSLPRVVDILVQLLEALQHAHECGVWHRDVKPSNLLLTHDGRVKLADFGIAQIGAPAVSPMEVIMGTPGYIAPETYLSETFDQRVDVFAAGAVLYLLLAGAPPFSGTPHEIMLKVCGEVPAPPSVAGSSRRVQPFDAIVMRALARDRVDRYASAAQFRIALLEARDARY
jgi:eukaryotic-like serine/threonine-protein kinase